MTKTTATPAIEKVAPSFPNASIDMNVLLANDAKGLTGDAALEGAVLVDPQSPASNDALPAPEPEAATEASAAPKPVKPSAD